VIAGRGFLSTRGDGPPVLTDTFTVGTRFATEPGQSLQVGLLGRILANFEPGTDIEWTQANPAALDLTLVRGLIAVRYERQPDDPVLNIHTPSALVRVVGTVFTVEVDAEGTPRSPCCAATSRS
jgi:ferric-dicitrate binding protein FerR (iron transport regulator)